MKMFVTVRATEINFLMLTHWCGKLNVNDEMENDLLSISSNKIIVMMVMVMMMMMKVKVVKTSRIIMSILIKLNSHNHNNNNNNYSSSSHNVHQQASR